MNIELDYIKSLVKMASENELTELKVSEGDKRIVIKKEKQLAHTVTSIPAVAPSAGVSSKISAELPVADDASTLSVSAVLEPKQAAKRGTPIMSPMVGTFYRSPAPDAAPFVEVGDTIKVGQVVCIIESMKLMNEIESEVSGTVIEICVENADAVENETVLMYIE